MIGGLPAATRMKTTNESKSTQRDLLINRKLSSRNLTAMMALIG